MPFNTRKQSVPALFRTIIENDEQRRLTKSSPVVSFADAKRLHVEHQDFMRATEKVADGTKDKGKKL